MKLVDVVEARKKGGGSLYLLVPFKLAEEFEVGEGSRFLCYSDESGIHYLRQRSESNQIPAVIEEQEVPVA